MLVVHLGVSWLCDPGRQLKQYRAVAIRSAKLAVCSRPG